ncbi:ubiquinone biosynthesis monooxygenase Coq7 [Microbotryomycetes sp. JL221]|nr:ubiquinone biosynthesis monooxygenase Coq7 [Microbotryomycetes sp. JL221]
MALLKPFASTSKYVFKTISTPSALSPSISRLTATSCRHHSSSATPPRFSPFGKTSAETEIPYGDIDHASSAYLPHDPREATSSRSPKDTSIPNDATTSTPSELTPEQQKLLEEIIRVDQAGEVGANYIYQGQHAVFKRRRDKRVADIVQNMWDGEKKHIATFDKLITQHGIRPTALYPFWKAAGWALGAGTALMGKRAAMACTEAIETVIGEHYHSQIKELERIMPQNHPSMPLLKQILAEFRDDELDHLDTAIANESQQTPQYALLSALIATGCRVAIATTKKV